MGFSIIFNKDTLFLLTSAQKKALRHLNKQQADFMPCFPLWCNLGEKKVQPTSVVISAPIVQGKQLIFPVSVKTDSQTAALFVLAGTKIHDEQTVCAALPDFPEFPISPRVFRIAETADIGENGFGTKNARWIKLG